MSDDEIDNASSEQPLSDAPHHVWQYCAITNHTDAKQGGAKNAICAFCDKNFRGCSTFRAAAHILGPECNPPARAGPGHSDGLDGSLLRKLTLLIAALLIAVAARSLSN